MLRWQRSVTMSHPEDIEAEGGESEPPGDGTGHGPREGHTA